jgi:hypothetical protein
MSKSSATHQEKASSPVTWDEVKDAELDDALRATPAQRLAWLEEAMRLAWAARGSRDSDESAEGHHGQGMQSTRPDPE